MTIPTIPADDHATRFFSFLDKAEAEARAYAAALIACAEDCERYQFTASQFRTVEIEPGA